MTDTRTIAYLSGARGETEFAGILDMYIAKLKADGWNVLFENDKYLEERSNEINKPTFENRMLLIKIT